MIPSILLFSPFQKGFVRAHTRKGKTVGPYFTKRQKKIGTVKHTKKTRVDYSEKDAQLKIKLLEEKKKHHNLHVEAAKELKEKVDSHKAKGHSTFKIGNKEHDISKVTKDLNNHIEHHSNEVKSHDNHISKIKDRYKTDREYFGKKKTLVKKESPIYKIEKIGDSDRYNFYYPEKDGTQGSMKGRPLGQISMFFKTGRATEAIPDKFEGREHMGDLVLKSKPRNDQNPTLRLEKKGRKYNIYYPTHAGKHGIVEGQTLDQAKDFFKRWAKGPDEFEGKHLLLKEPQKRAKPKPKKVEQQIDRVDYESFSKDGWVHRKTALKFTLTESVTKTHFKELMRLSHNYNSREKTGYINEDDKEKFLALTNKMKSSSLKRAKTSHKRSLEKFQEMKQQSRSGEKYTFEDYVEDFMDQHVALMSDKDRSEAYKNYIRDT